MDDKGGEEALIEISRAKPLLKNRVAPEVEDAVGVAEAVARTMASVSMMSRSRSHAVRVRLGLPHPFEPAKT